MMAMDITYGFIVEGSATTSTSMFFRTNPKLLRPIHSLLDEPFDFAAGDSIAGPLRKHLAHRADFDSLVALGRLYDRAQSSAQRGLIQVRPLLEESLSVVVRPDTDLRVSAKRRSQVRHRDCQKCMARGISVTSAFSVSLNAYMTIWGCGAWEWAALCKRPKWLQPSAF